MMPLSSTVIRKVVFADIFLWSDEFVAKIKSGGIWNHIK